MLSFKSIFFAAATLASIVSAIPTPETGNSLNIAPGGLAIDGSPAQATPANSHLPPELTIGKTIGKAIGKNIDNIIGKVPGLVGPAKRGGSSCEEVIKKCHDDIAVIVVKIS